MLFASAGAGSAAAASADHPPAAPVPELDWSPCETSFECAEARVPLDYRDPTGDTLTLAVIRKQATEPGQRLGTLYLQPGGPGGSGVDFVKYNYAELPDQLRERFDVVSMDVRGVHRSNPVQCWDDARYDQAVAAAKGAPGPGAFEAAYRQAADFNQACAEKSGDLLPFIGTGYVARDLDLLRQGLGEEKLSFYGRSFGTYVGTVYASLFPQRVRAMALDGGYNPVDHTLVPYRSDRAQYRALDGAMERFLQWCADHAAQCGFGDGQPRQRFQELKQELDDNPVPVAGGKTANGYTLAYRLLFNINAGKEIWPALGKALQQAVDRDGTSFLLRPPSPASYDFLIPNVTVECTDRAYPPYQGWLRYEVKNNVRAAPLLGPALTYGPPTYDHTHGITCSQWPVRQVSRYSGPYNAPGSAPILVIGTTGDPDTPYQDSVALARELDNGRLLTFEAEGHTAFGRSQCATTATTDYLVNLTLPAPGQRCTDEQAPTPPPAKKLARDAANAELYYGVNDRIDMLPTLD
ncbi:alpha/beta fold hydrolase [Streptomyces sp. JJ66]|nr:alpha/beta hydrolase [Streptomyces sp. JJ66]MBW1602594.1 alpha/beta fold hydrolase [Streptomyces sp. JJ66]